MSLVKNDDIEILNFYEISCDIYKLFFFKKKKSSWFEKKIYNVKLILQKLVDWKDNNMKVRN